MIRKILVVMLLLVMALCMATPFLASGTSASYMSFSSNGAYDGGLWDADSGSETDSLHEYNDSLHTYLFETDNADMLLSQTFTPTVNMSQTRVSMLLSRIGTPSLIRVSIYSTAAGNPVAELASVSPDGDLISTDDNGTWTEYALPISLTAGTQYAIVLSAPFIAAGEHVCWGYSGNSYLGGGYDHSHDAGATWDGVAGTTDFCFKQYGIETQYSQAHQSTVGVVTSGIVADVGQRYNTTTGEYQVDRGVVAFDTSHLSAEYLIQSGTLRVWLQADESDTEFDLTIVDGSGVSSPLATGDYHILYDEAVDLGHVTTVGISTIAYTDIALNAEGLKRISNTGYTKFGLRSDHDVINTTPTGDEYVSVYMGESVHPPVLVVSYTLTVLGIPDEMGISKVAVFTNFKEVGDELFIWHNTVMFNDTPYAMPQSYFAVELVDSLAVVQGQVAVNEWGYAPLSLYLSAAQVVASGIGWGDACDLVLTGTALYGPPAGFTDFTYNLAAADWVGLTGPLTDQWVKRCNNWLEDMAGVARNTYSTTGTDGAWRVNPDGPTQAMLLEGIPYIDIARPNLFLMGGANAKSGTAITGAWADALYDGAWGPYWTGAFGELAGGWGLGGRVIIGAILGVCVLGFGAVVREKTNDPNISLVLMFIAAVLVLALGGIPMVAALVAIVIVVYLLYHNVWLSRT